MTRTKALLVVLVFLAVSAGYADWQVLDLGGRIATNQASDTLALCSLRDDVQRRIDSTNAFLKTHPNGFPGISVATLRSTVDNELHTITALSPLRC